MLQKCNYVAKVQHTKVNVFVKYPKKQMFLGYFFVGTVLAIYMSVIIKKYSY